MVIIYAAANIFACLGMRKCNIQCTFYKRPSYASNFSSQHVHHFSLSSWPSLMIAQQTQLFTATELETYCWVARFHVSFQKC